MTFRTALRATGKPQLRVVDGGRKNLTEDQKSVLIEQYKDEVRRLPEGRHGPFYDCAFKLLGLGLPDHENEWHLLELEQDNGKTGGNWTKDAMVSLQKLKRNAVNL